MDPVTGLMIGGMALNIFGQWQANMAQAQAERENAAWLAEQAEFIEESTERSLAIYERQAAGFTQEQMSLLGGSGVELSGTASDIFNDTLSSIDKEIDAIVAQGEMQKREALLKSMQATRQAQRLSSPGLNLLQAAGPALTTAGALYGRGGTSTSRSGGSSASRSSGGTVGPQRSGAIRS